MIATIANIFRIPELRKKLLFTVLMLCIYRVGFQIPVPGVDQEVMAQKVSQGADESSPFGRLAGYLQVFTGGRGISTGDEVRFLGDPMRVSFSDALLGRIFTGGGRNSKDRHRSDCLRKDIGRCAGLRKIHFIERHDLAFS